MADDKKIKARLIKKMKASLIPRTGASTDREGMLYDWFTRKLDGVVAFGMAPADDKLGRDIVRLHYVEGRPMDMVCSALGVSRTVAYKRMKEIFEAAADIIPNELAKGLLDGKLRLPPNWRLKGCPRCGGDMHWEAEPEWRKRGGEWVCILCGKRVLPT